MSDLVERRTVHVPIYGGASAISGTVREVTTPVAGRQVLLIERESMRVIRETWTASDGTYSFSNMATGVEYMAISFDPTAARTAVASDRIVL